MTLDLTTFARDYLEAKTGADLSALSGEPMRLAVTAFHPGGWDGLVDDHRDFIRASAPAVTTPLADFARMRRHVNGSTYNFRLRDHEEVLRVVIEDDRAFAVIRVVSLDERSRRVIVTKTGLRVLVFEQVHGADFSPWVRTSSVVAWDDEVKTRSEHIKFGAVMTPARRAESDWQAMHCYRPGTESAPMDGPLAEAEMVHKDWFVNETFQAPTHDKFGRPIRTA